jgi:hypothetical protein
VRFKFHRIERSLLEALICRGGREVGAVIRAAWEAGARMDSWDEYWDWEIWKAAVERTGIDFKAIVNEPLDLDAPLPWSNIRCRMDEETLKTQRAKMWEELGG